MAQTLTNVLKRPHPDNDSENSLAKARFNNGNQMPQTSGNLNGGRPGVNKIMADARAKAAAVAAKLRAPAGGSNGITPDVHSGSTSGTPPITSAQSRIDLIKARVAAATSKASIPQQRTASPVAFTYQAPVFEDVLPRTRGGLDVGLHPALMGDTGQEMRSSKGKYAIQPKFATTMANRRTASPVPSPKPGKDKKQLDLSGPSGEETRSNPYFDPALGAKTATLKGRYSRHLIFNQKGKYIQQAAALRRQAAIETLKKQIAKTSRKAGIDEDLDAEKDFLVPAPPDIEWWDEGLVNGKDYSTIDTPSGLKLDTPDSIVTLYIQHPIALDPPQEKNMPTPKPMYLTPTEQAKLRRQRRMADLKEQQAKVRLGLEPAPPPKVKKSNLMRVLGEEAVKDPTAVEARVNREIAERAQQHMATNEARKLTKEQRHEKLADKQASDAAHGIYASVYKIDSLANGRHRFKISKNAEQHALSGLCILHPKFSLVIVEGGQHSINAYKKLMLQRIDWTENNLSTSNSIREGNKEASATWLQAEDNDGTLKDLASNKCVLVWEGAEKMRVFRKWGSRVCETDTAAKEALTRAKMESFWTLAKSLK